MIIRSFWIASYPSVYLPLNHFTATTSSPSCHKVIGSLRRHVCVWVWAWSGVFITRNSLSERNPYKINFADCYNIENHQWGQFASKNFDYSGCSITGSPSCFLGTPNHFWVRCKEMLAPLQSHQEPRQSSRSLKLDGGWGGCKKTRPHRNDQES